MEIRVEEQGRKGERYTRGEERRNMLLNERYITLEKYNITKIYVHVMWGGVGIHIVYIELH